MVVKSKTIEDDKYKERFLPIRTRKINNIN